jgi:hypothetical protein
MDHNLNFAAVKNEIPFVPIKVFKMRKEQCISERKGADVKKTHYKRLIIPPRTLTGMYKELHSPAQSKFLIE